jgi:hypothetical protein
LEHIDVIAKSFQKHIDRLARCIDRLEGLHVSHRVSVTDVELVYLSAFLSASARWESFMEDSVFEASCGRRNKKAVGYRYATFRTESAVRDLLLYPKKNYIDIGSLKDGIALSSILVKQGLPLSRISEPNQTHIQEAVWIRNAIAHQSNYSLRVFRDKVPGVTSLLPLHRRPGPFLRAVFRTSPMQRRYEIYFTAFKSAAKDVMQAWK